MIELGEKPICRERMRAVAKRQAMAGLRRNSATFTVNVGCTG